MVGGWRRLRNRATHSKLEGRAPAAGGPDGRRAGSAVAGLVQAKRARPALAPRPGSLYHLDLRSHAAANPGQDGHPLLATLDARVAGRASPGWRPTRHRAETLGGTGLLLSSPKPA